jgi:fucose permease
MRLEPLLATNRQPTIRWLTFTAWVSLIVFAATSTLMSVSLKEIGEDLQIDYGARGAVALARALVLGLCAFGFGWLADRVGKRHLLGLGMCVVTGGLLAICLGSTYANLVIGTMVVGGGLAALEALASPLIADLHPDDVDTQMNILHAFFPLGVVISSPAIGFALDKGVHWRVPFGAVAIPAILVGAMYFIGRFPRATAEERGEPVCVADILRTPIFWALAVAMHLTAGCEGALLYWSPNFMQDAYGVAASAGAAALAAFTLAMAVGRFGTGAAARRVALPRIMLSMAFLGTAATAVLLLTHSVAVNDWALVVAGLAMACFWPSILTVANRRIAAGSATLMAMLAVAGISGFGIIPWLVGQVADAMEGRGGLRVGLILVPVSLALSGLALFAVFHMDRAAIAAEKASAEQAAAGGAQQPGTR